MPSKEEIREIDKQIAQVIADTVVGINWESDDPKDDAILAYYKCAKDIRTRLDKLGVVIKVDKELPSYVGATSVLERYDIAFAKEVQKDMLRASYVAVEPLI